MVLSDKRHRLPVVAAVIALAAPWAAEAGSNCMPITAPVLEIAAVDCTQAWSQLQATGQFPDVFAGSGKKTNLCFASTAPVAATIGSAPVTIKSTVSGWTTDFTPFLLGGGDNLGTVVTALTIADVNGNSLAQLFTRDTIDLSQLFTTGTASEEDVIVGGTAYFTGAQGTYRVGSVPENQQASKVKLLNPNGVLCLNGT
jgi:hypothetical protein